MTLTLLQMFLSLIDRPPLSFLLCSTSITSSWGCFLIIFFKTFLYLLAVFYFRVSAINPDVSIFQKSFTRMISETFGIWKSCQDSACDSSSDVPGSKDNLEFTWDLYFFWTVTCLRFNKERYSCLSDFNNHPVLLYLSTKYASSLQAKAAGIK